MSWATAEIREDIRHHIEDEGMEGWAMIGVGLTADAEEWEYPFTYSIGFFENWRHPEVVICCGVEAAAYAMQQIAEAIEGGRRFADGEDAADVIANGYLLRFREVDARAAEVFGAFSYYGHENVPVLQALVPDVNGHFPGCDHYDGGFYQPLLPRP